MLTTLEAGSLWRSLTRGATALSLVIGLASTPRPVLAQAAVVCVNCSTTFQQLIQYAKQLEEAETQLQQYATQLQQYANMVQNTVALPEQIYSSARGDMQQVQNLMTQGSQLSFNNMSSIGSFSSFLSNATNLPSTIDSQAQQYAAWSIRAKDGLTAAMTAVGLQNSQLATDDATMTALQSQAGSATGQMQAIQNSAAIAAQGVRETEKLRQLMMIQIQMQANSQQTESETTAAAQALLSARAHFTPLDPTIGSYPAR